MRDRNENEPNENYRWRYEEYRGAPETPRRHKSGGLKVFLIVMGVLIIITAAVCTVNVLIIDGSSVQPPVTELPGDDLENLPEITQQNKPAAQSPSSEGNGVLTPQGIYKKCASSVVGVISYGNSAAAQGSGIVLSADGYIITNAHVVNGGGKFEVVPGSGETYEAVLIGSDVQTDLALLRMVDVPDDLVPATFGNSDELEVGEMVVAIGNPGGLALASTQTVGYVSAVERTITTESGYTMVCIQADTAINPGNSGGPLINCYGQVVGITSSKLVEDRFEGIGFSIPINKALPILDELLENGRVTGRARLGIHVNYISPSEAAYYNVASGLLIQSIDEGSDLLGKDIRVGDIITAIEGWSITSIADSSVILSDYEPGDTVTIAVFRPSDTGRSRTFQLDVKLIGS